MYVRFAFAAASSRRLFLFFSFHIRTLTRAIVVNVIPLEMDRREAEREFDELIRLVATFGGIVILKVIQKRGRPSARTFLGEGKAEEVALLVRELHADMVIIDDFLKPNQSHHLVNIIPCEVMDRFELILMIFEKHALSPEAKLQIELMRLKYEFPKLFGMGASLGQQRGGTRAVGGGGEKMLEVKRRHLRRQIDILEQKVEQFRGVRMNQRSRRKRENFFTVSLVGYTNAGKSSLLTALTRKENVVVADKLFSTLDTRLGAVRFLPDECDSRFHGKVLLSDTIGFIRNLPPLLFKTFLATLEEVIDADVIAHVIDMSDPKMMEKIAVVDETLHQMACHEKPSVLVFNKTDCVSDASFFSACELFAQERHLPCVFVSVFQKHSLPALRHAIIEALSKL